MSYLWDGNEYDTMQDVADAAGIGPSAVYNHLERHGHLENIGKKRGRRPVCDSIRLEAIRMVRAGNSQTYTAQILGVSQQWVSKAVKEAKNA